MRKVNDFVAMDSKSQKSSAIEAQESSTKRIVKNLESDISKKQKVDENVEPVVDDSKELRKCIEIVSDDGDEVLIEAIPISSRSPTIIDYKIHKEGNKTYFKIIRADSNSQVYQTFENMFKNFNREDLEVLWAIVKDIFKKEKPLDDMDNILFRTLKTMFEHHVEDTIWKYQQGLAKVYPLTRNILHQLWSDVRLQVDYDVEMAYDLLRFIRKQLMKGSRMRIAAACALASLAALSEDDCLGASKNEVANGYRSESSMDKLHHTWLQRTVVMKLHGFFFLMVILPKPKQITK
uniref:Uncharacterized protein n=1 Tax=Tanacetum cinerariifolium TaxID=118510 RepID=A0A6L2L382_TANCI|nr:hypothetical protein [Tanacetum cinerariifolium]